MSAKNWEILCYAENAKRLYKMRVAAACFAAQQTKQAAATQRQT
jgi:hypothetical protein